MIASVAFSMRIVAESGLSAMMTASPMIKGGAPFARRNNVTL